MSSLVSGSRLVVSSFSSSGLPDQMLPRAPELTQYSKITYMSSVAELAPPRVFFYGAGAKLFSLLLLGIRLLPQRYLWI